MSGVSFIFLLFSVWRESESMKDGDRCTRIRRVAVESAPDGLPELIICREDTGCRCGLEMQHCDFVLIQCPLG
jgi:hypothetical protein